MLTNARVDSEPNTTGHDPDTANRVAPVSMISPHEKDRVSLDWRYPNLCCLGLGSKPANRTHLVSDSGDFFTSSQNPNRIIDFTFLISTHPDDYSKTDDDVKEDDDNNNNNSNTKTVQSDKKCSCTTMITSTATSRPTATSTTVTIITSLVAITARN